MCKLVTLLNTSFSLSHGQKTVKVPEPDGVQGLYNLALDYFSNILQLIFLT